MEKEKISVVIPTYNRERTLKRSIESVLKQTYLNIEIIIIDDCSTDNTEQIVKSFNNEKIRYIRLDKNSGACVARNKGIEIATGDYIAFQDSDDEWLEDKLEKQMKVLKETGTVVTFCAFNFVPFKGKVRKKEPNIDVNCFEHITSELLKENFISTQTILAEKKVFENIKFDVTLPRFQDWDIAIRISKAYKMSYLNEALVNLYIQKDSITMNYQKKYDAFKILYNKYYDDIKGNEEIEYMFKTNIALTLFNMGKKCNKELKESLKLRFNMKILVCYISYITKTNEILIKLKKIIKGE